MLANKGSKRDLRSRYGLGLRPHYFHELQQLDRLPILEIMSDNLLDHEGGPALDLTCELASQTSVLLHGVGLDLGGSEDFDLTYLNRLKRLCKLFQPEVVSDHLCFTRGRQISSFELLPLAKTSETINRTVARIQKVQEFLSTSIAIENVSAYVSYRKDSYSEGEFISEIVKRSGCSLLLDTNNLYVNSVNFSFSAIREIRNFPLESVIQIHVAGHTLLGDYLFDTHDQTVCKEVLDLTSFAVQSVSESTPIILEWDDPNTPFSTVFSELKRIETQLLALG